MLKVSHDAFEGSYTMFHHWREGLEELSSIHVDPLSYSNENYEGVWRRDPVEPLIVLLVHADAYGRIPARFTQSLADRLQGLMEDMDPTDQPDPPDLRGPADWALADFRKVTDRFIGGLRDAGEKQQDLTFR